MSPSPLVAIQWSWHPTKPPASSCRKSCLESESQNADYFVARSKIDNSRQCENSQVWSDCVPIHQPCHPRVVTCDSGDIGGQALALIRPGGPTSRSRHRVIKRWDGLIWTNRGLLCFNEHFTDPALFVINTDTRDSFDAIAEIPLIYILNSLNLLSLKWTQNKKSAIKKRFKLLQHLGRVTREWLGREIGIKWK